MRKTEVRPSESPHVQVEKGMGCLLAIMVPVVFVCDVVGSVSGLLRRLRNPQIVSSVDEDIYEALSNMPRLAQEDLAEYNSKISFHL